MCAFKKHTSHYTSRNSLFDADDWSNRSLKLKKLKLKKKKLLKKERLKLYIEVPRIFSQHSLSPIIGEVRDVERDLLVSP